MSNKPSDDIEDDQDNDDYAEPQHLQKMSWCAQKLSEIFAGHGFCLLIFPLHVIGGRVSYISNASRPHFIQAMKEFVEQAEGKPKPGKLQ